MFKIKKKLVSTGNSRAVIIPDDWLKTQEEKLGRPIEYFTMAIDENSIILRVDGNGTVNSQEEIDGKEEETVAQK